MWIKLLMAIIVLWSPAVGLAGAPEDYEKARINFAAAGACQAAYSNRQGNMAIAAFTKEGWVVEPYRQSNDKADVKFVLAWDKNSKRDRDVYMLAIAGTESVRDAKVDMRAGKVPFAGATLEEFEANAARKDLPPEAPRVHEGFNQVTQLLLSVDTVQSNDDQKGTARKLWEILRADTHDKIYITGHSLGGSVAELFAARLLELGVRPDQIEVITFGAAAVGNEAFVQQFDGKFPLTRFVTEGDPVPHALRKVYGGYRHLGKEVTWTLSDTVKTDTVRSYSPHDMAVYLDAAIKRYLPLRRKMLSDGLTPPMEPIAGKPRLYVAPIKNSLPKGLQEEFAFMRDGLLEDYDDILPGYVPGQGGETSREWLKQAAEAGCDLMATAEVQAVKMQNNTYYVSLIHNVYRVSDGQVVSVGSYGNSTKTLTPLLAFLNGARTMYEDSAAWAGSQP